MNLHRRALPLILLACLFPLSPAWGEVTPTLNSDAIKASFGSYGVEVIDQAAGTRVANLYSGHGADKVCRTLAVTEFTQPIDESLLESHKAIVAGASIGATLRAAGFTINKKLLIKTEFPQTRLLLRWLTVRQHWALRCLQKFMPSLQKRATARCLMQSLPKPTTRLTSRQFMKK